MTLPILVLIAGLMVEGVAARPDCECFCLDGVPRTLCTSVTAAAARVDRCAGRAPALCPARLEVDVPRQYAAPVAGAENCRDAHVYDSAAGAHRPVRVCDVAPDEGP